MFQLNFKESVSVAFQSLREHKMRSLLTMLGIIIGVAVILIMQAVMSGVQGYLADQLDGMGADSFVIQRDGPIQIQMGHRHKHPPNIDPDLKDYLKANAHYVKSIDLESNYWGMIFKRGSIKSDPRGQLRGGGVRSAELQSFEVEKGRMFTEGEVDRTAQTILLGSEVEELLFPNGENSLGEKIWVGGNQYQVIGTFKRKGSMFGQSQDFFGLIPYTTLIKNHGKERSFALLVQAKSVDVLQNAVDETTWLTRKFRRLKDTEENNFSVVTREELAESINQILGIILLTAVLICGVSLLVGGIGIMNTMMVSVTERTREIGVRMALGARRSTILTQFVLEAATLSAVGGGTGVLIGLVISWTAQAVTGYATVIPTWVIVVALSFSSIVGLISGWYPAAKASQLDPIDALRWE